MSKEEKVEFPQTIKTEDILDPRTRWLCQRLDRIVVLLEYLCYAEYCKRTSFDKSLKSFEDWKKSYKFPSYDY